MTATLLEAPARTRTVSWADPIEVSGASIGKSGLEWLESVIRGESAPPPSAQLLGIDIEAASDGSATFSIGPGEFLYNPMGTVNGGIISTLADYALTAAVMTRLGAGEGAVTLDLRLTFVRPATVANGRLRATGEVEHLGGSVGVTRCTVIDEFGTLIATGTATCQVRRPKV